MEKPIPRAGKEYEFLYEDFHRVYELCSNLNWLRYEDKAVFDLWTKTDNEDQKWLIEKLLSNFTFLDDSSLKRITLELALHIENEWKLTGFTSKVVATCDGTEPDGSQLLLQKIKNKFINIDAWKESDFLSNITYSYTNLTDDLNIILLDDFIGTGNTIEKRINKLREHIEDAKVKNVKIYLVAAASMEFAREKLDSLKIQYFCSIWLKKGITEMLNGKEQERAITEMINLEKKLSKNWDKLFLPSFGYKKSETLFAIGDNNIPNNVFPIFWWPYDDTDKQRIRLFTRVSQRK